MVYEWFVGLIFINLLTDIIHAFNLVHLSNIFILRRLFIFNLWLEFLTHEVLLRFKHLTFNIKPIILHFIDFFVSLVKIIEQFIKNFFWHFIFNIFDLSSTFQRQGIDIIIEETSSFNTIWKDHDTDTLLNTFDPMALKLAQVCPLHGSISLTLVIMIVSLIFVS